MDTSDTLSDLTLDMLNFVKIHVICQISYVSCPLSHVICNMSLSICHMLHITCYILYVTCYILHVTCYMLHVICYMSHWLPWQPEIVQKICNCINSLEPFYSLHPVWQLVRSGQARAWTLDRAVLQTLLIFIRSRIFDRAACLHGSS